jgi:hypothetical protein
VSAFDLYQNKLAPHLKRTGEKLEAEGKPKKMEPQELFKVVQEVLSKEEICSPCNKTWVRQWHALFEEEKELNDTMRKTFEDIDVFCGANFTRKSAEEKVVVPEKARDVASNAERPLVPYIAAMLLSLIPLGL